MLLSLDAVFNFLESQPDYQGIVSCAPPQHDPIVVPREEVMSLALSNTRLLAAEPPEIKISEEDIRNYLDDITPDFDPELYGRARRAVIYLAKKLFDDDFQDTLFASPDLREMKHVPEIPREGAVLYMPNHSAHVDSFLLSLKLSQLNLDHPYFAAGDNLMAQPAIAQLFRATRAFKVIRRDKEEPHLRALSAFCKTIAECGLPQLTYPEASSGGARTRDGTLRIPFKLRTIEGIVKADCEVTVVPVSFSYTRVPEDYSLAHGKGLWGMNLLRNFRGGTSKSSFLSYVTQSPLRAWFQARAHLYGKLYMTFGEPFVLQDFLDSLSVSDDPVEAIERHVMVAVGRNMKVLPHYVVAAGLDRPEAAVQRSAALNEAVEEEVDKLKKYHQDAFGDEPDFSDDFKEGTQAVVDKGLVELERRRIVSRHRSALRPSRWKVSPSWIAEEAHVKILDPVLLTVYHNRSHHNLFAPEHLEKICVVGAGQWGYTIAAHLGRKLERDRPGVRYSVLLTDSNEALRDALDSQRKHPYHFSHLGDRAILPDKVNVKSPKRAVRGASVIVIAVPSHVFRQALKQVCTYVNRDFDLVVATKGIETQTGSLMIQIAEEVLAQANLKHAHTLSVLSGANLASEILAGLPAAAQITSADYALADRLRDLFATEGFKVFTSTDVIGTQLAGALKNVYAVSVGLADGLELGNNLKAILMSRATPEARRLSVKMGGSGATFDAANQAWMADLITTCLAGRNHAFGLELGKAWAEVGPDIASRPTVVENLRASFEQRHLTVEGDQASIATHDLASRHDVEMPIAEEVFRVLHRGKNPYQAIKSLFQK